MSPDRLGHRRRRGADIARHPEPTPASDDEHIFHTGIDRVPRERIAPSLPINERAQQLLELLTPEPQRAAVLAEALGWSKGGISSTLYALQDRKLAERVPYKGWRRT